MGVTVNCKTILKAKSYHVILCPGCDHYRKVRKTQTLCAKCREWEESLNDRLDSLPRKQIEGKVFHPPVSTFKPKEVYRDSPRLRYLIAWFDAYSVIFLITFWMLIFGILPFVIKAKWI